MNNFFIFANLICGGKKMDNTAYRPGEQAPESGNYTCYDENGNCGGRVYLEKGQRFPATQHSGSTYKKEN